jgi:hypothetical protein
MAGNQSRPRPNVLLNFFGGLFIVFGVIMTLAGLAWAVGVMTNFHTPRGDGPPVGIADGMALAFWGIIALTVGRYFRRGARKRGVRDRFGRLLIITGYVLLGVGLDRGVHSMVGLWAAQSAEAGQSSVLHTLVTVAVWAIPGAILAAIGFKLAGEKALATAEVKAEL